MKRKDNVFSKVFTPEIESNSFDLSHDRKLTFNMGELVPINLLEVLPGDQFDISFVNMLRFTPLIAPVMHKIKVMTEYFFVPSRILWSGWEDFITGLDTAAHPFFALNDAFNKGTVADYLGIPPGDYTSAPFNINVMQMAAYAKIYDEWYRDQNLQSEVFTPLVAGDNTAAYETLFNSDPLHRCWEHDYFTSALPFTQQGTEVSIPLTFQDNVPVTLGGVVGGAMLTRDADTGALLSGDVISTLGSMQVSPDTGGAVLDPNGRLVVDIQSEAASINDLRQAFSLQSFLERSLRGGLRYIEQLYSLFNVRSSDARLQRPEFIGRDVQNMVISEVLATAQSSNDIDTAEIPVGGMAGHGISVGGRDGISFRAEEHGYIMGIISVIPDTAYESGVSKQFSRFDRLDYAFPDFAHLGEQAVLQKELNVPQDLPADNDIVFGYLPRYSEYRYEPSRVSGDFRDSLAYWTLGRKFGQGDVIPLNSEFVTCRPRTDIFAVTDPDVDHVIGQIFNKVRVQRKLPRYGVPSVL